MGALCKLIQGAVLILTQYDIVTSSTLHRGPTINTAKFAGRTGTNSIHRYIHDVIQSLKTATSAQFVLCSRTATALNLHNPLLFTTKSPGYPVLEKFRQSKSSTFWKERNYAGRTTGAS